MNGHTKKRKRKICFVITSEIHYARNKLVLEALRDRKDVDLQIVVGASAILPIHGNVPALLARDKFPCSAKILMTLEGSTPLAMAKTAGLGMSEFASVFDSLSPDIVVVRGDRYEVLSAAIAAAYLNIVVAHIEGGDVTGTIDESVRHAITKLAHIHFATNEIARVRLLRMGENPKFIFNVGSPEIEFIVRSTDRMKVNSDTINRLGVGGIIDTKKPYIVIMYHPVTTEYGSNGEHAETLLNAVQELDVPAIWFWPNVDAGADEVSRAIRSFREKNMPDKIRFIKYLPPEEFHGLVSASQCLVGNSSAGIKECSYFGIPVVNIGTRQNGRVRAENVRDVPYKRKAIFAALTMQIAHGKYKRSSIYYKKNTSKKIAHVLVTVSPPIQKRFMN